VNTVNQVGIYNMALGAIGVTRFVQSTSDANEQTRVCNVFWESSRDQCLGDFEWSFANRFASLQLLVNCTPGWKFTYGYPSDCLSAREIVQHHLPQGHHHNDRERVVPFQIVENEAQGGLAIATNKENARLRYTARIPTYTLWSSAFVNALSLCLATKILCLSGDPVKYGPLVGKAYEAAILKAGALSMNEHQNRPEAESEYVTARD
jgi:hypothetical protein